jgi:hypothetical protein
MTYWSGFFAEEISVFQTLVLLFNKLLIKTTECVATINGNDTINKIMGSMEKSPTFDGSFACMAIKM